MINLTTCPDVYLHREFVDFRKSINGLSMIVEANLQLSPFSTALFVFCNRRRDKLKVLYWDKTGFCLWYKRLEKAKFKWPKKHEQNAIHLTTEQFNWLLRGFDISQFKPHPSLEFTVAG
ncbi:IS66 family insertion sequence element accessory protein TnpB [Zooshikella ganghwensis]|uniref:Transposase n=1 Tax=Zooshikella ganghwensis TaxID=202772 RepID=A0A4P9VNL1_9GAMM|nr:IS66 family insertion sequence element accessory protein TnpB [Zooshikella ganghwensis]RDH44057.1 transposase [Zooshikella ganghwensis]